MNNFFGFPKPRKAGFGSADIPSGDVPLDTTDEDVVLEGTIVDFGEAGSGVKVDLSDLEPGLLDPFKFDQGTDGEDINSFLQRMMGVDLPSRYTRDDVSGPVFVDVDAVVDMVKKSMDVPEEVPNPTGFVTESIDDTLNAMNSDNERLQNFIDDAMKNIKNKP